jgi:hypothetical protein
MPRKNSGNGSTPRTRKPKVVEASTPAPVVAESRKILVPINLEEEIRQRAYEIYVERGSTPGNEHQDWLTAEREVRSRYEAAQTA